MPHSYNIWAQNLYFLIITLEAKKPTLFLFSEISEKCFYTFYFKFEKKKNAYFKKKNQRRSKESFFLLMQKKFLENMNTVEIFL